MYDTIKMELGSSLAGKDLIKTVVPLLDSCTEMKINNSRVVVGYLNRKLKVNITNKRVKIQNGDLKNYFFTNPFFDFKRGSFEEAIQKLSDELKLPMHKAKVTRIDIGPTMSMEYDAKSYLPHFGLTKGYKRLDQDNGITYKSRRDVLCIYHKQNQLLELGRKIPIDKKDRNHLRCELRVKNQIETYFKKEKLVGEDLYNEEFYIKALDLWANAVKNINRVSSKLNAIKPTSSKKDLLFNLSSIAVSQMDQMKVYGMVKEWQKMELLKPKQAYDLRSTLSKIYKQNLEESPSILMNEFDKKIKQVKEKYL